MELFYLGSSGSGEAIAPAHGGSKASNLARLARIGLRVPPAFVLGTEVCRETTAGGVVPDAARAAIREGVAHVERLTGRRFGDARQPLLVSVRSSPPVSMPGMLETVLNVGLTDVAIRGLLRSTGNPHLVWDTARRFAEAYAEIVCGCPRIPFVRARERALEENGVGTLDELDPLALREVAREAIDLVRALSGRPLPADPYVQLESAVAAVFRSWSSPRAEEYRRLNGVAAETGTAVIIQAMVLGNTRAASGSGVGFTRNPSTGADELYVDFLLNAQGEDVVSGREHVAASDSLREALPDVYRELLQARRMLEAEFRDMQDFEFTVQDGELYLLQSRTGKRTAWAALHIAVDLVESGLISPAEALARLSQYDLDTIQRVRLAPAPDSEVVATAVPAGIGVASGAVAFDAVRARALAATQPVLLVREDLTTDDISGLAVASGILTARGGRTSHAAVVARHLDKVCLVGCASLSVDESARTCRFGTRPFSEGDVLTLDGESGSVYAGAIPVVREVPEVVAAVRRWQAAGADQRFAAVSSS